MQYDSGRSLGSASYCRLLSFLQLDEDDGLCLRIGNSKPSEEEGWLSDLDDSTKGLHREGGYSSDGTSEEEEEEEEEGEETWKSDEGTSLREGQDRESDLMAVDSSPATWSASSSPSSPSPPPSPRCQLRYQP